MVLFTVPMHAHRPSSVGRRDGQPPGDVRQVHITYTDRYSKAESERGREDNVEKKKERQNDGSPATRRQHDERRSGGGHPNCEPDAAADFLPLARFIGCKRLL